MNKNKLPLLEFVDQEFNEINLSKSFLIASQNLLGSTEAIIDCLIDKGLSVNNIYVIGKSYSSSSQVIQNLQKKNIYVSPSSTAFKPELPFDQQFEEYIRVFIDFILKNINLNDVDKIIILDEGHRLLEIASSLLPKGKIIGIEQSSKKSMLENLSLNFPCITIARTKAKLFVESPMIAKAVNNKLLSYIKSLNFSVKNILIIGNGFIGKSIAHELRALEYNIKIYDHNEHKSELDDQAFRKYIKQSQVIISCIYGCALQDDHYNLLSNNVILASASLSDRAFKAADIRRQDALGISSCHQNVYVDFKQRKVHLMNCGFPINFCGETHSVPPNKIQITRALLLGAIYEGISSFSPGVRELSEDLQNKILQRFFQLEPDTEKDYNSFLDINNYI
jgi:S-adenosylhomocysteine hydrolase